MSVSQRPRSRNRGYIIARIMSEGLIGLRIEEVHPLLAWAHYKGRETGIRQDILKDSNSRSEIKVQHLKHAIMITTDNRITTAYKCKV